jgi:hypothetical protein
MQSSRFSCSNFPKNIGPKSKSHLQRLQLDQASLKKAQAQLRSLIRCYFLDLVNHDGNTIRKKWVTQHWTKIAKLSHELGDLLFAVSAHEKANGPPTPEGAPLLENLYKDHQLALLKLEILARRRLSKTDIEKLIDEEFPNTKSNTRVLFQFGVLEVWMHFGGKLGVSRHPVTGKVTGPLARYFSAVTQPICGGSPESLPDIVARQETLRAARRKLRRELGP